MPLEACFQVFYVPVAGVDAYVICILCALAWRRCEYVVHIQDEEKWTMDAALGCSSKELDLVGQACSSLNLDGSILQE